MPKVAGKYLAFSGRWVPLLHGSHAFGLTWTAAPPSNLRPVGEPRESAREGDMGTIRRRWPRKRLVPTLLDRLLELEPVLRRRRRRQAVVVVIAAMVGAVAWADANLWPGMSLAFGYAVPITLTAYVFGIRRGVALSLLCVVLRRVCAGRAYGPWWLYAGSALMLTEYLMLAVGGGLLGRAARRLARQTRTLQRLSEYGSAFTTTLDPEAIWRQAVEAAVRLTGADGGFVATATGNEWQTAAVFFEGTWQPLAFVWWPDRRGPWREGKAGGPLGTGTAPSTGAALERFRVCVELAVPIRLADTDPGHALVVCRAEPRLFEQPTREVLSLFASHIAAALQASALYRAAVQAMADKGRMLAHLAQELAVPLHVVMGAMDVLTAHVDEIGRTSLERLRRQERLLLEMTGNLLEYARLEAGKARVRHVRIDVPELYAQIRDLAEPLIGDKDVQVVVAIESGAEAVESDPERLRRIIANLAVNAVKYTPAGRVELIATREKSRVRLAVSDTGPGITPSERQRIFEPFYRGGDGQAPGAGVGLGLALAQELAHLLGTEIAVEGREHSEHTGMTFSLALPAPSSLVRLRASNGEGDNAVRPAAPARPGRRR
jgi:signal transduction histidine kinase